jgi:3-oxoadipate enol-lactonase
LATDVGIWDRQLPALEARFRVVRADLRGHGGTTATSPPYDLALLGRDVIGLLDALSIDRVAVLGVSLGAIIALGLALDAPARIERIVVADCRADAPPPYVAMWDTNIAAAEQNGMEPVIEASVARWFSPEFRSERPDLVDSVRTRALRTPLDGFIGCARAVQGIAYLPRLADIAVPTLFVVGQNDGAAPPEIMRDMAGRVPGAQLVELAGAGHLTPMECGDRFTDAVLPFLAAAA